MTANNVPPAPSADGSKPAKPWYQKVDHDLNRGAGGAFIYVWTTRDPDCSAVRDIVVLQGSETTPSGYNKLPTDLNQGAGGALLYLAYLKQ